MAVLRGSANAPTTSSGDAESPAGPDRVALGTLYKRYAPAIYARCYRLLHSEAAARDATQETFGRLLGHNRIVLTGDEGLHYLYRVSTNVCFNLLREQRVRERAAPELVSLASTAASPDRGHADRQFAVAILARCDETGAAIAVMHYIDGMTQVEVADVLGITRRTVFNRLRKLESLANELLRSAKGDGQGQP
ncbi:MAG TPA: sigma-70 family RNA polymerase sigma factor [Polyangia bacterium]|nr:sigma-70 family RNA polymerase sigma factor [Polyangia bacterium]